MQPAREEETLQDDITHGMDQEVPAEKNEKEDQLESQTTLEDVDGKVLRSFKTVMGKLRLGM